MRFFARRIPTPRMRANLPPTGAPRVRACVRSLARSFLSPPPYLLLLVSKDRGERYAPTRTAARNSLFIAAHTLAHTLEGMRRRYAPKAANGSSVGPGGDNFGKCAGVSSPSPLPPHRRSDPPRGGGPASSRVRESPRLASVASSRLVSRREAKNKGAARGTSRDLPRPRPRRRAARRTPPG